MEAEGTGFNGTNFPDLVSLSVPELLRFGRDALTVVDDDSTSPSPPPLTPQGSMRSYDVETQTDMNFKELQDEFNALRASLDALASQEAKHEKKCCCLAPVQTTQALSTPLTSPTRVEPTMQSPCEMSTLSEGSTSRKMSQCEASMPHTSAEDTVQPTVCHSLSFDDVHAEEQMIDPVPSTTPFRPPLQAPHMNS